jgi:hypothetical protein
LPPVLFFAEAKFMKAWQVFVFSLALLAARIGIHIHADYDYSRRVQSYWNLGIKASTLQQKSVFLDQYVAALEGSGLTGSNDALVFKTPDNSFDENMVALKSLQGRINQIKGMDEQSFAYQTAIQQITAQEQGEAEHLVTTFKGCWYRRRHFSYWSWVGVTNYVLLSVFALISLIVMTSKETQNAIRQAKASHE